MPTTASPRAAAGRRGRVASSSRRRRRPSRRAPRASRRLLLPPPDEGDQSDVGRQQQPALQPADLTRRRGPARPGHRRPPRAPRRCRTRWASRSGRTSAASPRQAVSIVTLAPIASPAASPGRSWTAASTAVSSSSGSAPASSTPTATTVTPSRRAAPAAFSTNSSAPPSSSAAAPTSSSQPSRDRRSVVHELDRHRRVGRQVQRRRCDAARHQLAPSAATIAPLSVHSPGRGTRSADAGRRAALLGHGPQPRVGRHPAADQQVVDALLGAGQRPPCGSARRRPPPGRPPRRRRTGTGSPSRSRASTQRATAVFRPGEREVVAVLAQVARAGEAAREVDVRRSPSFADAVDVRPAREGQAEHPRDLVERLAGRVVDGGAERLARRRCTSRTSSSDECPPETSSATQGSGSGAVLELVDRDVRGQVVDAVQRLVQRRARAPWPRRRRPAARRSARARW